MTQTVKLAVAGAGLIGQQHIERILKEPRAAISAIIDPAPKARELAERLGVPHFTDLAAAFSSHRPDGVIIATPNQMHVPGGLAVIEAGIPLLLEKPVSDHLPSAKRLVEASEASGVPILVGHHRRHSPLIKKAKEIIASGRLGRITAVNALCWFRKPDEGYFDGPGSWRKLPGGGVVLINLIHVIDDLRNLCGDVTGVQAAESNAVRGFAVEDTAAIILHFANGALGTLSISDVASAPWSWEMTAGENKMYPHTDQSCYLIAGTEGSLSVPRLELWHYGGAPHWGQPIEIERSLAPEQDPLVLQLQHFCDVALGKAKPLLDCRGGTRTLEATLAVKQASEQHGLVQLS